MFMIAVAFAAAAVFLLNGIIALADEHHEGHVYDSNGWEQVAEGWNGKIDWAIDSDFPTNNHQGYNIRSNMRDGMDAWSELRFSDAGEWANEITTYADAVYQYVDCSDQNECYGSNIRQWYDDDEDCDHDWGFVGHAGHDHDHGPICFAVSHLDHDSFTPSNEVAFRGAIVHEMGHAFGLQEVTDNSGCDTIMNGCWAIMNEPGSEDEDSMDKIYGLPHDVDIEIVSGTTIKGSALDYSEYEDTYRFELWKWNTSTEEWDFLHSNDADQDGDDNTNGTVSYSEDVSDEGCGNFLYGVWAENEYPDDLEASQFGGFTTYVYVCGD